MPYLLSPAGSPESLKAALDAGADEVYLGGQGFNARQNAKNFSSDGLIAAAELCREKGAGLHITLNTLVFDREIVKALDYVGFLQEKVRPDALIVQDVGLASEIRRLYPEVALHASTQMRLHSPEDVGFVKDLGFTRAVLARELTLEDIKSCASKGIETEIFIHGALCVCESGGCLMSSVIGNRSGNRGECAQPCRLPCRCGANGRPLSLKDLCLAEHIEEIIASGVTALKIEGRMKSPDYVYAVTAIYRRLLDEKRSATKEELDYLNAVFSRDGFTDGYFTDRIDGKMFGFRPEGANKKTPPFPGKKPAPAKRGNAKAEVPPYAEAPRYAEEILSPKEQRGIVLRFEGKLPSESFLAKYAPLCARIDVPLNAVNDKRLAPYAHKLSALMPRSVFASERENVEKLIKAARDNGVKQITVTSVGQFGLASEGFYLHGDYTLNVTNRKTLAFYEGRGLSSVMLSPETEGTFPKGSACALEYIGYGRTPLMYTRACIIRNIAGCKGKPPCKAVLTDRTGAEFPVFSGENHTNTIYNSLPSYRLDRIKELKRSGVGLITLLFTDEDEKRMEEAIALATAKDPGKPGFGYTRK